MNFVQRIIQMKHAIWMWMVLVTLVLAATAVADPARYESAIRKFEQADAATPPKPDGVLFVGSSSIRLWNTDRWFAGGGVIRRGFGGSEIGDTIHFADRIVFNYRPRVIVMYAGDNDVARGKDAARVFADFKQFAGMVNARLPKTTLIYIAIKPSIARWNLSSTMAKANRLIRSYCDQSDRLVFADVWTPMLGEDGKPAAKWFVKDGLHLNEAGYKLWTGIVAPLMAAVGDAPPLTGNPSAGNIIARTGVAGGLIVHLNCGDGKRTAALHAGDAYVVQGLDTDAAAIAKARAFIHSKKMYGPVSVVQYDGRHLPYVDNTVNLVVADTLGGMLMAEVMRVLAPNGVAYIGGKKTIKPRPDNIDEWSHFLHDASGNAVAEDDQIGPPNRLQWVAGPRWCRTH